MKIEFTKSWMEKCLLDKNDSNSPSQLTETEISEITDEAILDLKSIFEHFIKAFNDIKLSQAESDKSIIPEESLRSIHIYDLADDKKGFMVFRKGCRLIFSEKSPGSIRIQMLVKKDNLNTTEVIDTCIQASINNIASVKWTHDHFKGFVNLEILARYYMKQFLSKMHPVTA